MLCNSSVHIGCGLMGCYFLIQYISKSVLACPLFCFVFLLCFNNMGLSFMSSQSAVSAVRPKVPPMKRLPWWALMIVTRPCHFASVHSWEITAVPHRENRRATRSEFILLPSPFYLLLPAFISSWSLEIVTWCKMICNMTKEKQKQWEKNENEGGGINRTVCVAIYWSHIYDF